MFGNQPIEAIWKNPDLQKRWLLVEVKAFFFGRPMFGALREVCGSFEHAFHQRRVLRSREPSASPLYIYYRDVDHEQHL